MPEPSPEGLHRRVAMAEVTVPVDGPPRLVPAVPRNERFRARVAATERREERAHSLPQIGVVEAGSGRETHVALPPRRGADGVAHMVDQVCTWELTVDPERLDLGDRADHHTKTDSGRRLQELVVVLESVASGLWLDPSPAGPELDRVQPGRRHAG